MTATAMTGSDAAPQITPGAIEAIIASEYYHRVPGTTLTLCVLTLASGFHVVGYEACVSPENFDAEIGRHYARENAVRQVWQMEGYRLRCALAERDAETEAEPEDA